MKIQKIRPQLAAPVKRETVATVSRDGNAINAIAPSYAYSRGWRNDATNYGGWFPFAGDDAE